MQAIVELAVRGQVDLAVNEGVRVEDAQTKLQAMLGPGFQVETPAELNLKLWEAKRNGLVSKEEKGTSCCYAMQDKFWVTDPDNVQWEVYYFHQDSEFNDPHYEDQEQKTCC